MRSSVSQSPGDAAVVGTLASVPTVVLHTRAHLIFHDLTDEYSAELGVLLVRVQRALGSIPGVGRVHVYKWGDGGAHLHVVVVARTQGMRQLWGCSSPCG